MFVFSRDQQRFDELTLRVMALEEAVSRLCAHAGVPGPDASAVLVSDEVRALVAEGKPIKAIKRLREGTGLGLRAAKLIVDELERNG